MAFAASLYPNNLHITSSRHCLKLCAQRFNKIHRKLGVVVVTKRKVHPRQIIRSSSSDREWEWESELFKDNGTSKPYFVKFERLFTGTQRFDECVNKDSNLSENVEADVKATLESLKRKQDALQAAETIFLSACHNLERAKEELEQQQEKITLACSKYEKLEGELSQFNDTLASQERKIEGLKLQLKDKDQDIAAAKSVLSLKEKISSMKNELKMKNEEAAMVNSELTYKAQRLSEAGYVVKEQEIEIQELQKEIEQKEEELEVSLNLRNVEKEKLEVGETNLENQVTEWLLEREALMKLASKQTNKAAVEEFRRLKKLLADVRAELILSQHSLSFSKQKTEEQKELIQKQLEEAKEQKEIILSYITILKDAHLEVESKRVKLAITEVHAKELERVLSTEKNLLEQLQEELKIEESYLQQAMQEMFSVREELERSNTEFQESQTFLQVKRSELIEAELDIKHLKSKQATLMLIVKEKDLELLNAMKNLEDLSKEVVELKDIIDELDLAMVVEFSEETLEQFNDIRIADSITLHAKQLESKLRFTRESLRMQKDELNSAITSLEERETQMRTLKQETSIANWDIKVKTAISALRKLEATIRQVLGDNNTDSESGRGVAENNERFRVVKYEVDRLLELTEDLAREAAIIFGAPK